jgi:hypothetical protein
LEYTRSSRWDAGGTAGIGPRKRGPTGTSYLEEIPGFFVAVVPSCRRDGAKRPVISEGSVTVAVVD